MQRNSSSQASDQEILSYARDHWMAISQPVGFIVALIGLMGKLELPPFDAPEAETEIVAGALIEYSGRGLAMFKIGKSIERIVGITLVSAFYLGGLHGILPFLAKNAFGPLRDGHPANFAYPAAHRSNRWHVVALWKYLRPGPDPAHHFIERESFMSIGMSNQEWEHAALNKDFMVYYGRDEDIAKYVESLTPPAVQPAQG